MAQDNSGVKFARATKATQLTPRTAKNTIKNTALSKRKNVVEMLKESFAPHSHTVCVVGLGYVGLPLALLAEKRGFRVIGIDVDSDRVTKLKQKTLQKTLPILSQEEDKQMQESTMVVDSDPSRIASADVVIICVPTPVGLDNLPDLSALVAASKSVGQHLKPGTTVVIESTVNPGICEEVVLPLIAEYSGLTPEKDFYFAHCPERINPGDETWTTANIPRVIGAATKESLSRAMRVYEHILDAPLHPMQSIKEAEAVKMVENSFRDINIAFVNELAMSFSRIGIDTVHVIDAASTKPFAFMAHMPGCGVGGHCIPVDPYYLIEHARQNGFNHRFLKTARAINNNMPHFTVDLLEAALLEHDKKLAGSRIALLGLAYKADIADLRESPALEIRHELLARGAEVFAYDPHTPNAPEANVHSIDEALEKADGVILATNHKEFLKLSPSMLLAHGTRILIDGRNALDKEVFTSRGITYRGIGR